MKEEICMFEQFYIDGFGRRRIIAYMPVDSEDTGRKLMEATLRRDFPQPKWNIRRGDDGLWAACVMDENRRGPYETNDNTVLRVYRAEPLTADALEDAVARTDDAEMTKLFAGLWEGC